MQPREKITKELSEKIIKELREKITKELGRPVPDSAWNILMDRDHLADARTSDDAFREVVEVAKSLLPYGDYMDGVIPTPKETTSGRKRKNTTAALNLGAEERDRAEALGEYLAFRATAYPHVRDFRQRVLTGELLTVDEASAFVCSEATRRFRLDWFEEHGVPLIRHRSTYERSFEVFPDEREDSGFYLSRSPFDIPADLPEDADFYAGDIVYVDPPGELFHALLPKNIIDDDLKYLRTNSGPVPVYPDSVLDYLRRVGERLTKHLGCAWTQAQSIEFILTGEASSTAALSGHVDHFADNGLTFSSITLQVQPWVPAGVVRSVYQDLQDQVLERKPHAPSSKNLRVFRFVLEELRKRMLYFELAPAKNLERPLWRELMKRWNEAQSEVSQGVIYNDETIFSRDFHRASKAVVHPFRQLEDFELNYLRRSIPEKGRDVG